MVRQHSRFLNLNSDGRLTHHVRPLRRPNTQRICACAHHHNASRHFSLSADHSSPGQCPGVSFLPPFGCLRVCTRDGFSFRIKIDHLEPGLNSNSVRVRYVRHACMSGCHPRKRIGVFGPGPTWTFLVSDKTKHARQVCKVDTIDGNLRPRISLAAIHHIRLYKGKNKKDDHRRWQYYYGI